MAITLTIGFFAHDIDFTCKFIGFTIVSLIFLIALLWFHILVYLEETGFAQVNSLKHKRLIRILRLSILLLTLFSYLLEPSRFIYTDHLLIENILVNVVSVLMFIFPEMVFKIIFAFEPKNKK